MVIKLPQIELRPSNYAFSIHFMNCHQDHRRVNSKLPLESATHGGARNELREQKDDGDMTITTSMPFSMAMPMADAVMTTMATMIRATMQITKITLGRA